MRILYCTDTYLPQINGVSIVTALSVAGLRDRGWEVRIIGPAYPSAGAASRPEQTGPAGIAYRGIRSLPLPIYSDVRIALPDSRAVEQEMREFRPDIVHCATEFIVGQLAMRAASRLGIPVVTSYHTNFGQYATAYGLPVIRTTVERYIRAFHERAVATLTPSDVSRQHLTALGLDRAHRWGCGVDPVRFHPRNRSNVLRESLGLGTAFTLLYVGRLAPEKQVETVVRSYISARKLLPPGTLRLVIAGTGPREAGLRRLAPSDTLFLGHLDR
ncbi:glycosyltransferase family 1 protein, partial [bacterium]|nr:glycosyltransferase family 1 protein [bacterium]